MAAPPAEIDWGRLSPAALEVVQHISLREAAGYSYEEIAAALDRERPAFRHANA